MLLFSLVNALKSLHFEERACLGGLGLSDLMICRNWRPKICNAEGLQVFKAEDPATNSAKLSRKQRRAASEQAAQREQQRAMCVAQDLEALARISERLLLGCRKQLLSK